MKGKAGKLGSRVAESDPCFLSSPPSQEIQGSPPGISGVQVALGVVRNEENCRLIPLLIFHADSPQPGIRWGGICSWDPPEQQDPGLAPSHIPGTEPESPRRSQTPGWGKNPEPLEDPEGKLQLPAFILEKRKMSGCSARISGFWG